MGHSHGYRARTRHLFGRNFREHGPTKLSTYMTNYKVGDYVDIKVNASIHKGMPFKIYQGKTGVVFNVTKSAVGILINKRVRHRYVQKRVIARIEHVRPSKCRDEFLNRIKENQRLKKDGKTQGKTLSLKRMPQLPRESDIIDSSSNTPILVRPIPYESLL